MKKTLYMNYKTILNICSIVLEKYYFHLVFKKLIELAVTKYIKICFNNLIKLHYTCVVSVNIYFSPQVLLQNLNPSFSYLFF